MKKVIDVSSYNGTVNWSEAKKQGIDGAILKIIRKDLSYDKQFLANQKDCDKHSVSWGVYNYSYAKTKTKAKSDMELICDKLDKLDKKHFTLGIWFDIEDETQAALSKQTIANIINAAQEVVESRGYNFGVYTGLAFHEAHIDKAKVKCKNWWIARYYKGYDTMKFEENPNEKYKPMDGCFAWQYTSSGTFSPSVSTGNGKKVDLNILYKEFSSKNEVVKPVAVKIGSARINEKGTINGGKAGDQTGGEVSTQKWYLHSKGWNVIRAKDKIVAEKIAKCMEMMCANNKIGYCQNHRLTCYNEAKKYDFDVSKISKSVEVDCSEAVRICVAYAGIKVPDFNTSSEKTTLNATGEFVVLTGSEYCNSSSRLKRGDILVTKTKGHTVVVLNNGSKLLTSSEKPSKQSSDKLTVDGEGGALTIKKAQKVFGTHVDGIISNQKKSLKKYMTGFVSSQVDWDSGSGGSELVKAIQKWANCIADGVWGPDTSKAVQKKLGVKDDGYFGTNSMKAFQRWLNKK